MEKLLNEELKSIVDENVLYYKEDLNYDLEMLLDKNRVDDTFIFAVRDSGTHLYEKHKLYANESGERIGFMYFKDSFKKVFEVNITRRGKKYSYGTIKEENLDLLIKDISKNVKYCNNVETRIIKKDKTVLDTVFLVKNTFYESLGLNGVNYEDVDKVYYLRYF